MYKRIYLLMTAHWRDGLLCAKGRFWQSVMVRRSSFCQSWPILPDYGWRMARTLVSSRL